VLWCFWLTALLFQPSCWSSVPSEYLNCLYLNSCRYMQSSKLIYWLYNTPMTPQSSVSTILNPEYGDTESHAPEVQDSQSGMWLQNVSKFVVSYEHCWTIFWQPPTVITCPWPSSSAHRWPTTRPRRASAHYMSPACRCLLPTSTSIPEAKVAGGLSPSATDLSLPVTSCTSNFTNTFPLFPYISLYHVHVICSEKCQQVKPSE
jgi:hypothetical protein